MQLTEIRVAGFGGQGVILSAILLGKAASIYQGAYATMTQNFRPGGPRRGLQRATRALRFARFVSLCDQAGHSRRHVAGSLRALYPGTERRRHSDRGAGSGASLRY